MGIFDFFKSKQPESVVPHVPRRRSRGYSAASSIARYGDIRDSRGSADYELREALSTVRAKIRFMARNSGTMKRYLQLMAVNVAGTEGFKFQSRVRSVEGGGMSVSLNRRVEDAWAEWCEMPTSCGQMTMADLTWQAVRTWSRDGEVIWEVVKGRQYTHGVAVNPLEADMLDETKNEIYPPTGNEVRMGVEINRDGRPVAYHFLQEHPGDVTMWSDMTRSRHRRVPADRVIHIYLKDRPGQTRGEPPASATVLGVKMLDGYREAETVGRRLRSALMGFFTRDMPGSSQIDELTDREDEEDEVFEMDMEPGRLKQLPDGMQFNEFSPGGSQTDYADFETQVKKDLSMGLGISNMSLGMEVEGISYSGGRTITIEDRDYYRALQGFFIRRGMVPLFRKWLDAHNLMDDAAFRPSQKQRVLRGAKFRGRGWDWVDPSKDVKANAEALETYQTSLTQIAAQRGMSRDDLLDEIEDDRRAMEARGLTVRESGGNDGQVNNEGADDDDASAS